MPEDSVVKPAAAALDGEWSGVMYGPDDDSPQQPTGVAGEFNGHFNNGHVAGAFGATRDSD